MKAPFLPLALLLSIATAEKAWCQAREGKRCAVFFDVYWSDPHIPGGFVPRMHKEQESWYNKKGEKEFPSACYDPKNATYVLVWSSSFESEGAVITGSGTSNTGVATVAPVKTNSVYVTVLKKKDSKTLDEKPLYATHRESWWTYRAAYHKTFEDALRFLTGLSPKK
jgi:hypothetical protein